MNIARKTKTKLITEGAIYAAAYALLSLLTRYLLTGTDSMIYYLYPVPLAIYVARAGYKYGIACLFASLCLSFIFGNPMFVLLLILPNLCIGFIIGLFEIKQRSKLINILVGFSLCLGANFLSIYAFKLFTGVGYFEDIVEFANKLANSFNIFDPTLIRKIVNIAGYATLVIDAFIKIIFIYILLTLIVTRLNLVKDYTFSFKIPVRYTPIHAIIYISLFMLLYSSLILSLYFEQIIITIILVVFLSIFFIYSIYLIYQFLIYIRLKNMRKNFSLGINILLTLLSFCLFPISIIYALVLNIISWK